MLGISSKRLRVVRTVDKELASVENLAEAVGRTRDSSSRPEHSVEEN